MDNHLSLLGDKLSDHTKLIRNLKTDLDQVYSRVRKLNNHLREKYPAELAQAQQEETLKMPPPDDE